MGYRVRIRGLVTSAKPILEPCSMGVITESDFRIPKASWNTEISDLDVEGNDMIRVSGAGACAKLRSHGIISRRMPWNSNK